MIEWEELNKLIPEKLKARGLAGHFVRSQGQLLEFPEEYFTEVVLDDAGKVEEAEGVLEEVRAEVERRGRRLDYIVRALWEVADVEALYNPTALQDVIRQGALSLQFMATLKSGTREQKVGVEITPDGYEELQRAGTSDDASLREVVKEFLALQLSLGGTGYWDPIRYPRHQINAGGVLYLRAHPPVDAR